MKVLHRKEQDFLPKVLKHCGLWQEPSERAPPGTEGFIKDPDEVVELQYVDIDTFMAEF